MKLLVCGDRNWTSTIIIEEWLKYLKPTMVIAGGARGADRLAAAIAEELNIPVKEIRADWLRYGRAAGPIRNRQMLDEKPDLVLAFHFEIENSSGTADTLQESERRSISYAVIGLR